MPTQTKDLKQIDSFNLKEAPVLNSKLNENYFKSNCCKKIFKRLKKKDDKEDKRSLAKRCKLDLGNFEQDKFDSSDKSNKLDKLDNDKNNQVKNIVKDKKAEPGKMLKKMKRILFDVEDKFEIKPDVELSSCSEDELERLEIERMQQLNSFNANQLIQDGQSQYKVGLSNEDDNTVLNLVYNWLAKLTLVHDNWAELKQLVREQPVKDYDLLSHLTLKSFNHKTTGKCVDNENDWKVLKSINSVSNQISN